MRNAASNDRVTSVRGRANGVLFFGGVAVEVLS